MATAELAVEKETLLEDVSVIRVGPRHKKLLPQLAQVYYRTWQPEGLCSDIDEALAKMGAFNPEDCFVVTRADSQIYALVQTLPVLLPSFAYLPHAYPTYASVEETCSAHAHSPNPNFIICFSINALPGYRVKTNSGSMSLARFLLTRVPAPPGANRLAYSRFSSVKPGSNLLTHYRKNLLRPENLGPVGMHEAFGGLTVALIENSRLEDSRGGGGNVLLIYPKNEAEREAFEAARARRLMHLPLTRTKGNITLLVDVPL